MLGCPNLLQGTVDDEDGGSGALDRADAANSSSSSGTSSASSDVEGSSKAWGALFLGHRGRGAYMADLYGKEVSRAGPARMTGSANDMEFSDVLMTSDTSHQCSCGLVVKSHVQPEGLQCAGLNQG